MSSQSKVQSGKTFLLTACMLLGGAFAVPAFASPDDDRNCDEYIDHLKKSYYVTDLTCASYAPIQEDIRLSPNRKTIILKGSTFARAAVSNLVNNTQVCGADPKAAGEKPISGDYLLPIPPNSAKGDLKEIVQAYRNVSETKAIGVEAEKKQLKQMAVAREEYWSKSLPLVLKNQVCRKSLCAAMREREPSGVVKAKCLAMVSQTKISRENLDQIYQKLNWASQTPKATSNTSISSSSGAKTNEVGSDTNPSSHNESPFKSHSGSSSDAGKP